MNATDTKIQKTLEHFLAIHEADAVYNMITDEDYTAQDIIEYLNWCPRRFAEDLSTDFDEWLDDRKPRVYIGFTVTEYGTPVAEHLWFPKRGEDMAHGNEYEWYYSLKEIQDDILKLKVGETIPFKIRDDQNSVGSVTRLK